MSTGTFTPPHLLLDGLVDDAGLFPPARLPMAAAVDRHLDRRRRDWGPLLLGRFLCPASRLDELCATLDGRVGAEDDLLLGLVLDSGIGGLPEAMARLATEPRLVLGAVEVPLPGSPRLAAAARDVAAALPDIETYVELPRDGDWPAALAVLADASRGAKLRTGGLSADAFPTVPEVAAFVTACVVDEVPFKLTAGLHHAVRHRDAGTGFEHHGFLNVLLATERATSGGDAEEVERLLGERDGAALVEHLRRLDDAEVAVARSFFTAFGSCSVEDPVDDLVGLGILDAGADPTGR